MADYFYLSEPQKLRRGVVAAMRTTFAGGKRGTVESPED